jgi:sugar lactone lactonase YvrE
VRLDLDVSDEHMPHEVARTVIGTGFAERTDPNALVIGPTGLGVGRDGTLYVADTLNNRIAAIPHALERDSSAGTGRSISVNGALNGPLGLAVAPNGNILTVNSNDGKLVETTPKGEQVAVKTLDATGNPPGAGTLFGLAIVPDRPGVYFVNDGSNTLNLFH